MNGKSETGYSTLIQELKNSALKYGLVLAPQEVVTDYEFASINAFKYHFPGIKMIGCFFHYAQALHRNFLRKTKVDYNSVKKWFKMVVSLALLPIDEVENGFVYILDTQPDGVEYFCDYVLTTWVGDSAGQLATFPLANWNHFDNDEGRTNNVMEGYNHKLTNSFEQPHPHIFKFIEKIRKEESQVAINWHRFNNNDLRQRNRRPQDIERDLYIEKLKRSYETKDMSLEVYIEKMSDLMPSF
jgi:hypothetical protein